MAVGQGSLLGGLSYISVGRETAFGTAAAETSTAMKLIEAMSSSLKTSKDSTILEEIQRSRVNSNRLQLGKVIGGDIEWNFYPNLASHNYILQLGFGGAITSATATGETVGGGGFEHTIEIGTMENSYTSLTFNERKGDSTNGKVFQYKGCRVNELTFTSELDSPLKCSASIIGQDSTTGATDIESVLTIPASQIMSFVNGRFSVESTFGSLTSSSFWHVQTMGLGLSNNLKSENESRRIGSDTLVVLPAGMAGLSLKATIRFDTLTAYNAMINANTLSAQLEFLGNTITGSASRYGLRFNLPRVFVKEAGEPEISGPDEVLTSEVVFDVMRDTSSASGYALQAVVTNTTSSYD